MSSKKKNTTKRWIAYLVCACSIVTIAVTSQYFYKVYKDNEHLKVTMEEIIKSHDQSESLSGDSNYIEYFPQDPTVDTLESGKVVVSFPSNK